MIKKNKLILITSSIVLPIPIVFSTSCSANNSIQDDANKIYSQIWNNVNNKEIATDANVYANSIYDFDSFKKLTKTNEIKNVPNNLFNVILNNCNYEYTTEGMLQFEVLLQSKNDNKIYYPKLNENDEDSSFFSNIIRINGFKKMDNTTKNNLNNIYNVINHSEFKLNKNGIDLMLNNNVNIESNINFDDPKSQNYFKNFIDIPIEITNSEFDIWGFQTNLFEQNKIIIDETSSEIKFNFWIIVALKSNPNNPLAINFGLNNNNGFSNNLKTINISYKPCSIFNANIKNIDINLASATKEEIIKAINVDWIIANKQKLFKESSLPIVEKSRISNINIIFDNNSINLSFDFVVNNTLNYKINQDIFGFNFA